MRSRGGRRLRPEIANASRSSRTIWPKTPKYVAGRVAFDLPAVGPVLRPFRPAAGRRPNAVPPPPRECSSSAVRLAAGPQEHLASVLDLSRHDAAGDGQAPGRGRQGRVLAAPQAARCRIPALPTGRETGRRRRRYTIARPSSADGGSARRSASPGRSSRCRPGGAGGPGA